jgi:hypothetical protein
MLLLFLLRASLKEVSNGRAHTARGRSLREKKREYLPGT